MATLTLEEYATWPAPNYTDPETRVSLLLGVEISFIVCNSKSFSFSYQ